MNIKKISTLAILLSLTSLSIFSAEIDQLTDRDKYQHSARDFTGPLNDYTNSLLTQAVDKFNQSYDTESMTDEEIHIMIAFEIYKATAGNGHEKFSTAIPERVSLFYALGKSGHGPIQTWIQSKDNSEWWIKLDENIYSDIYPDSLNQNYIIKVGGEFVGPDKIDHFFDQGYSYWLKSDFGQNDGEAIEFGVESEYGWYGLKSGGVFSFADLRANWEGYQFFFSLFDAEKGHLALSDNGTVRIARTFDWNDYIDWQYDELKNPCYITKANMKKISRHIEEHYEQYDQTFHFLEDQNIFDYIGRRDDYYVTDNLVFDESVFFDLRELMSES